MHTSSFSSSPPWDEGVKCKIKTPAWLVYCCLSCFEMFFCVFQQMFTLPSAILSFVLCLSCLTFVVLVCLGLVACMCLLLISCFIFHRSAIDFKLDLSCCKIIVSSGLPPPPHSLHTVFKESRVKMAVNSNGNSTLQILYMKEALLRR